MHYLNERESALEASGLPNSVNAGESAGNTDTSDLLGISCHALVSQLSRFCLDRRRPRRFLHMFPPSITATLSCRDGESNPQHEKPGTKRSKSFIGGAVAGTRTALRNSPSSSTHLDLALRLGDAHL